MPFSHAGEEWKVAPCMYGVLQEHHWLHGFWPCKMMQAYKTENRSPGVFVSGQNNVQMGT